MNAYNYLGGSMKYMGYVVLSFMILGCIFVGAKDDDSNFPLLGKVYVIDAGHGGKDPGTSYKDIYEKDINLNIAKYLEKELIQRGASVIMTREGDYDLSSPKANRRKKSDFDNRIKIINESNADLYFSIHINYLRDSKYKGIQVFYLHDKDLAVKMQDSLNAILGSDREAKKMANEYYMYEKLKLSGVLIECGFLSNPEEREKLITNEYQKTIAKAIADSRIRNIERDN